MRALGFGLLAFGCVLAGCAGAGGAGEADEAFGQRSDEGEERETLLDALGRPDLPVTDAADVASSKPAPDLLVAAADQAGLDLARARMIGDSPWDAIAAGRAGATAIAVRCGAFGDGVLREAGAQRIVDAPADLVGQL